MKINPSYGVTNRTITTLWIPRNACINGLILAVPLGAFSNSFKLAAGLFAAWWVIIFALTYKDPQFTKLFWRAWRRKGLLCPWRVGKSARKRLQHV
jgi:hypothetical protein